MFFPAAFNASFGFNKPFLRPRWLFPVCIRALIKLNPNKSEGGAVIEDLQRGRQEIGYIYGCRERGHKVSWCERRVLQRMDGVGEDDSMLP